MFKKPPHELYKIPDYLSLNDAWEFKKPTVEIYNLLKIKLSSLELDDSKLVIETPLKNKTKAEFSIIDDLIGKIKKDLETNFNEYTAEFQNTPFAFVYYLGYNIIFSSSLEIVQKIYNSERDDLGYIYYSIVIKHRKGKFIYWGW